MERVFNQMRMALAESLFGWCLRLVPKGDPDGVRMAQAIAAYFQGCQQPRRRKL